MKKLPDTKLMLKQWMSRQPWLRSSSAVRLLHHFVVSPLALGSEQNMRSASASPVLCFSTSIQADLPERGLQSPGWLVSSKLCLNTPGSSKIYSTYALFLLCFSFYSHCLQLHTAIFIFSSRVQRRVKCLGCVIVCMVTFRPLVMPRSN